MQNIKIEENMLHYLNLLGINYILYLCRGVETPMLICEHEATRGGMENEPQQYLLP